jgi:chromosome segregation ATPase
LQAANELTEKLQQKVDTIEAQANQKVEARQLFASIIQRLEQQTESLQKQLETQTMNRINISNKLETTRAKLRRKLKTKTDIERVLLDIEEDMDTMKDKVKEEIRAKEQLEWMMEIEIQELHRRLNYEAAARERLTTSLEQALSIRQSVLADLEALKHRISQHECNSTGGGVAIGRSRLSGEAPKRFSTGAPTDDSGGSSPDLTDALSLNVLNKRASTSAEKKSEDTGNSTMSAAYMVSVVEDIEKELEEMSEILAVDDLVLASKNTAKQMTELKASVADSMAMRMEVAEKNEMLETELQQVKKAMAAEREERAALAKMVAEERQRREELEKKVALLLQQSQFQSQSQPQPQSQSQSVIGGSNNNDNNNNNNNISTSS